MRRFPFTFVPLHSYNLSIPLLYEDSHPYSRHSHADSPHSHHSHPDSPHSPHSQPDSPHSHPDPRIPIIPTLIPRIPIIPLIPFPGSPFRLLQIAIALSKTYLVLKVPKVSL